MAQVRERFIVNGDAIRLPEQQNLDHFTLRDQFNMPRPCYYALRFLGAWQPRNCHWLFDLYSIFSYVMLLISMFAILGRYYCYINSIYSNIIDVGHTIEQLL